MSASTEPNVVGATQNTAAAIKLRPKATTSTKGLAKGAIDGPITHTKKGSVPQSARNGDQSTSSKASAAKSNPRGSAAVKPKTSESTSRKTSQTKPSPKSMPTIPSAASQPAARTSKGAEGIFQMSLWYGRHILS